MKPKITIITGYYNREEYVDYSIKSLLDQSFTNFELIIFDDCSSDKTYENLKAITKGDDRVVLIRHEKNTGFVKGLIKAIEISKGDYIAIHGSGDISHKDRIYKQSLFLDNYPEVQVVGCHYINRDPANNISKRTQHSLLHKRTSLFSSNPLSHGEVMFRKSVYSKVGGYRDVFKFSQDKDLWLRMSTHGDIAVIQEVLYERIINFEGVSYKVEKLIEQKKYSYLANIINNVKEIEQEKIINNVKTHGINSVINSNELFIQKNMFKMFNVLLAKNKLSDTELFSLNSKGWKKIYYKVLSFAYKNLFFRRVVNNIYRISSNSN